jgi:hypothetical protein
MTGKLWQRSFRPRLDILEDRALPSTLTVTNLNDLGAGSLRAAINSANASPGSTINFLPGLSGSINLNSALPAITTSMEIDGPAVGVITLNAQSKDRVFRVTGGNVTITHLTIANGRANFGGGIDDEPILGSLSLTDDTFANNQANVGGGALNIAVANVTVTNCVFTGDRVVGAPGYTLNVGGGAIFSFDSILAVVGSRFANNTVLGTSGALGGAGTNLGQAEGGAVWDFGDIASFTNCTFAGNSARAGNNDRAVAGTVPSTIGVGQGGAMVVSASSSVEVDQCTFSSNLAQGGAGFDGTGSPTIGVGRGGAVRVDSASQFTVTDSTFTNNRAKGANFGLGPAFSGMNQGEGGAISAEDTGTFLQIAGCTFNGNTAVGGIGGSVDGVNFAGSTGLGGALYLAIASADISGSTFSYNVALGSPAVGSAVGGSAYGGAICALNTQLTISGLSELSHNRAQGGMTTAAGVQFAEGGGIFAFESVLTLQDLDVSFNQAIGGIASGTGVTGGIADGGGISVIDFSIVHADSLTIESNVAQGGVGLNGANGGDAFGGGVEDFFNTQFALTNSLVTLNRALGGIGVFGGSTGGGFGGGVDSEFNQTGIDLSFTTVAGNLASTSYNDIRIVP